MEREGRDQGWRDAFARQWEMAHLKPQRWTRSWESPELEAGLEHSTSGTLTPRAERANQNVVGDKNNIHTLSSHLVLNLENWEHTANLCTQRTMPEDSEMCTETHQESESLSQKIKGNG